MPLLHGGVRSLFAGAGPSALFRVAHGALYLPIYCAIKSAAHDSKALPEPLAVASAAAAAVTATALVELPLEALMLRVKAGGSASFAAAARSALASPAGLAGLWAGAAPYGACGLQQRDAPLTMLCMLACTCCHLTDCYSSIHCASSAAACALRVC